MDEWGAPLKFGGGGAKKGGLRVNFNFYTPNKLHIKQRESGYVKEAIKLKESYALKSFSIVIVFFQCGKYNQRFKELVIKMNKTDYYWGIHFWIW